jgi:peroxiredoxin Q/BCP
MAREPSTSDPTEPALIVGRKAPAFSLKRDDDTTVKLSEQKGQWVVLYFYPKDDTPGCTTEACDFTAGIKQFEKLDAVVFGCSPDSTESHRKFIAKYKLKVPLLSDPDHAVMEAYGAWGEKVLYGKKTIGVIRSTVIISPEGKIAHHWRRVKTAGHADAVRENLTALRAAAG